MIFDQGDIIEVNFDPTRGHEPAKTRPALVLSSYDFNRSNSMTIVAPITSRIAPFFLHQELPEMCCVSGTVVMEQIRAIDLDARSAALIGRLDRQTLRGILACVRSFFDEDDQV